MSDDSPALDDSGHLPDCDCPACELAWQDVSTSMLRRAWHCVVALVSGDGQ